MSISQEDKDKLNFKRALSILSEIDPVGEALAANYATEYDSFRLHRAEREMALCGVKGHASFGFNVLSLAVPDPAAVMFLVKKNPLIIRYAAAELRADKEIATEAVRGKGAALEHVSLGLRDDPDVVFAAVQSHVRDETVFISPMKWASNRLKRNRDFMDKVIEIDPDSKRFYLGDPFDF